VFLKRLYVRIWLAVVLAVAVMTLLVGWVWRSTVEPPLREVVVRNAAGDVVGGGRVRFNRNRGNGDGTMGQGPMPHHPLEPPPGATQPPREGATPPLPQGSRADADTDTEDDTPGTELRGQFGAGPEATVRMVDGQVLHMHMPRAPNSNWRAPFGFFWSLGLVALAVALAIYPIVRRLTRRLEALQSGVERWGQGDLSARLPASGGDEVGFLAQRFNHAAEQIETLMKTSDTLLASQKSLLANASHELRSPLTRIRMGLELLGNTPGAAAKDEITRNIGELDQLIDEILLASRLDAQEANLGTVEPVDLVGLCAEECARSNAALDVDMSAVVVPGVAKLLRRVVRNLLENARRYATGEVTVVLRQSGNDAVLQVNDNGPGVPADLAERIFEPFYRLPGASEREGGVGLGLALVKSIAQRHGGSVRCSNRSGGGACFEVRLPLQR
jgi:signal transduction histidine kinase